MGKITVISKAFMEKYWDNYIEKAMSHKYIRKIPNSKGGYYYIYPKDFAKPMKVLLSIFGMKEEKIDDSYKNNNIQEAYGVNKQGYAAHLLEYLSNKSAWNKFFGDKFNRDRYKTPIKTESKKTTEKTNVKESEIKNNGKTTDKTAKVETKEKDFKSKWNNSLMRKIYSMYNPVPEDKKTETNNVSAVTINVNDSVSFNGKAGKVTKDFGNGMVFVNFDNGGMGRFKKTDLQNLNPTNQESTNSAELNGGLQTHDGTENNIHQEDEVIIEKPGFNKVERAVITVLYNQIKKENPGLTDFGIARRIKEQYPELDAHGDVGKTMAMVKNLIWDSKITEDVATYINTKKVAEKTQEEKDREWHEKWDVRLADEFVKGKEKYLNAKPLVSTSAMFIFNKIWDQIKDKTRNEQIKWLYNGVKDFYQLNHTDIEKYRKQGLSDEEIRFGYINAFLETKNPAEEHENRSQAMMGNDNAKKYGLTDDDVSIVKRLVDKYNFTKEQFASSAARTGNIKSINDYAKEHGMKAYDVALDVYDIIINNKTETVEKPVYTDGEKTVNTQLSQVEKNVLSLALENEKRKDPTMSLLWYIEKVKEKLPELANKVDNWTEIENIKFGDINVQEIKDYAENVDKEDVNNGNFGNNGNNNGNNDNNGGNDENESSNKVKKDFADFIDNFIANGYKSDKIVNVLDSTPTILQEHGIPDNPISITPNILEKVLTDESYIYHGHNLAVDVVKDLPNQLENPVYIIKGKDNKKIIVTEHYVENRPIIAVLEIDRNQGRIKVNSVRSVYDKRNDVFSEWINNPDMVEYENTEKSKVLLQSIGNQYAKEVTTPYSSNNSINSNIVNTDTSKLSEAMLGNDNAKGKHNVKPQTESEMKTEQKKEKEARKKAGLPNPGNNVGDRVSAIDDADTWNPNSDNYRFKDTGYIAGSRKEMASMFIMERAKRGERIDAHELDFDGLEENPRAAEKLITKSNIFGEVDWVGLREKGMSGSTAFLIDRIYASAGSKPDESNAQARKQYVIALNGLRDRFEECKTVPEVIDTLKEIREEIRGEYVEIKEMPEYKKITDRMKSLNEIMRNKRDELMGLSEQGRETYNVERQKIIEKYIQKGKDEKKLRWNTRVSEYNIPKEYEADFSKETKGLWDKVYEPWKKAVADFKAELISRGVKEEDFYTNKNTYNGKTIEVSWYDYYTLMPEAQEYGALSSELDAYIKKMKVAVSMKNPLLEAWKSLGKRFTDILYSDSFNQHKYECTKGTYDNWEWLEKEVKVTEKKTGKEKKRFQLKVANSITRKGGRDFNLTTTQDLKKAFNLREVQSGNWVLKDPASAEFHVRNASNAFADLADVTGIGDDKISLNGRLSMAFGARGTGNAGGTTAMAHYEPVERVINLTKFKGGGCLGHEWFHAFDNMITSAMTGDNSIADVYLTNMYHGMTEANKLLLEEYVNLKDADLTYSNVYRKNQLKKQLEKKGVDVSEIDKSHKSALQIKVQNAFDDVVKAMTEGTFELMTTLNYEGKDYKNMLYNMSEDKLKRYRDYYSSYSGDRKPMQLLIADAGSLDDAVREIHKRYERYSDSKSLKNKRDWLKIAAAYYDRKPDGTKGLQPLIIPSGKTGSQFLADAKNLDNQDGKAYWSETHEMAARAFSSYIEDTLQSLGRQNDYLAYASDNKYYGGDKPYPEGEERKRINAAFKKLFEVINSEQAIQKSIEILDKFVIEKSEPRFIIKDGRFLIRK